MITTHAWKQTYSGRAFEVLDPDPATICIEDIAHSLALTCRFGGHCSGHYSVAEHSIRVMYRTSELLAQRGHVNDILSRRILLAALLHDAAEAYLCDMSSPLKHGTAMGHMFAVMETTVARCIEDRFDIAGLLVPKHETIAQADLELLATERRDLMAECCRAWDSMPDPLPGTIVPDVPWQEVEADYLAVYNSLTGRM